MKKILLNSGRNCLRYIARAYKIAEINIPYYICPVVWQALREEKVSVKFYHIDKNFMPQKYFDENEYILYPNYFGICSMQNGILAKKYKNLISDNAHAFFAKTTGLASFSSPRKFFKSLNDGGILYCDKELNEVFPEDTERNTKITDYNSFCLNELSIDNQSILAMSEKTRKTLENLDFEYQKQKKLKIFSQIHEKIGKRNNLKINLQKNDIPYVYPYLSDNSAEIANSAEKNCIYLIKYGTDLPSDFKNLLMLPLTEKVLTII